VNHFGKLDIAVVNAGILLLGDVATVNVKDLDRMLDINVRGVFLAIQAAAARLTDGGRIITIGSNTAVRSGHPGSSVYSMTKAAVAVMVKVFPLTWQAVALSTQIVPIPVLSGVLLLLPKLRHSAATHERCASCRL
jgi:NAD(P)-dependent dehydrogenase (short-subunit alcohol dehydrogenase family)